MRILIAHSFYRSAGGEDTYVQRQVDLLQLGHDVTLLQRSNQTLKNSVRVAINMTWSPHSVNEVEASICAFRPDIVHLHNAYPGLGPAPHLAAERQGIPLVMTVHNVRLRCPNGLMFTQGAFCDRCEDGVYLHATLNKCFASRSQAMAYAIGLWVHRFPLALERRVAVFIAPSGFMAEQLTRWGIPPARIIRLPNFTPLPPGASAQPGERGVYLGRLASEKGLNVLLRALAKAGDPPFSIVGTGPLERSLWRLAAQLRLKNTEFMGHLNRSDVEQVLAKARFVALPSLSAENAPLAALEAMAAGRPLLVSAMGGLPELTAHGAGITTAVGDAHELAKGITDLMGDDRRCRDAGSRGLEYAEQHLDPKLHRSRLEEVYDLATRLERQSDKGVQTHDN